MLDRKQFPEKEPHIGTCQVSGDTGAKLVTYKGTHMLPVIKKERQRSAFRPTAQTKYEEWKENFDRWTSA